MKGLLMLLGGILVGLVAFLFCWCLVAGGKGNDREY